ncbi:hypothetical protein IWQ60_008825 [Tieghemiomyces parasiticus]|uniref:Fe2OG dioxygenase domain-containing protein n=1 Tax=Tieghemiomyces parasiticus TaxID=78921 RepID=A0A9W7ZW94_9FUNG|nr:hypothetical protein IWQ60_008825 [Tieghemiomyces parasiticus]
MADPPVLFSELFGSDPEDEDSTIGDPPLHPIFAWGLRPVGPAPAFPAACLTRLLAGGPRCTFSDDASDTVRLRPLPGLLVVKGMLCPCLQAALLDACVGLGYFATTENNQVMHFGPLPTPLRWLEDIYRALLPTLADPPWLGRTPLFDQLIGNLYRPGQGIRPHVDLARFEDGIGIVSLGGPCQMAFAPASPTESLPYLDGPSSSSIPAQSATAVYLEPGDVLTLAGEARYQWTHAIPEAVCDRVDGEDRARGLRISLTLRRVHEWARTG